MDPERGYTLRHVADADGTDTRTEPAEGIADDAEPPEPTPRPKRARRVLHVRIFSSASDAPRSRRPIDAVLLVISLILVSTSMLPAPNATTTDTAVTNFLQGLPGTANGLWQVCYDLLLIWPVVLMVAMLVAKGRKRVLRDMVLALLVVERLSRAGRDRDGQGYLHAPVGRVQHEDPAAVLRVQVGHRHRADRHRLAAPDPAATPDRQMGHVARVARMHRAGRVAHDRHRCGLPDRDRRRRGRPPVAGLSGWASHDRGGRGRARRHGGGGDRSRRRTTGPSRRRTRPSAQLGRPAPPRQDLRSRCTGRRVPVLDLVISQPQRPNAPRGIRLGAGAT